MTSLAAFVVAASGWQMVGPFAGSATAVAIDARNPQHLIAGARNALVYETKDAGESWKLIGLSKRFPGTVTSLLIDPADSRHFLAGLNGQQSPFSGIYESWDGGASWRQAPELAGVSVEAMAAFPADSRRLAAGTRKGLWLSEDGGAHWRRISQPDHHELLAVTAVAFHPSKPGTLFAGTTHLPWKTTDSGAHWTSIHEGLIDDSDVFSILVNPAKPEQVYASACSGIYVSQTGGNLWRKYPGIPGTQRRTKVIRQDPSHPEVLYAGTTVGLLRTLDSGASWRLVTDISVNGMVLDPTDPKTLYIATESRGMLRSRDRGDTFLPLDQGFIHNSVTRMSVSGERIYATAIDESGGGGLFQSSDSGRSWSLVAGPASFEGQRPEIVAGNKAYPGLLFTASGKQLRKSTDSGIFWTLLNLGPRKPTIQSLEVLPGTTAPIVLAGTSDGLWRSTDGGSAWTEILLERKRWLSIYHVNADTEGSRLIARTSGGIFQSSDKGVRWLWMDAPGPSSDIYDVAIPPKGYPVLAATTSGLFRHGPEGWIPMPGSMPIGTVNAVRYNPSRPGEVYSVQFGRVFRSRDGGSTWSPIDPQPSGDAAIRSLYLSPDGSEIFALTPDLGVLLLQIQPSAAPASGSQVRVD